MGTLRKLLLLVYRVFRKAITLSRSSSVSRSIKDGMPLPPALINARTLASVTGLPLTSVFLLNRFFRPGPIFLSSLSELWQTEHCSNTSLPLAASPAADRRVPANRRARPHAVAAIVFFVMRESICLVYNLGIWLFKSAIALPTSAALR